MVFMNAFRITEVVYLLEQFVTPNLINGQINHKSLPYDWSREANANALAASDCHTCADT